MIHLFIYLIEASICLLLLYLCYVLLINNDTFYRIKRVYLIFSVLISIAIPQLPSIKESKEVKQIFTIFNQNENAYSNYKDAFENVVFGNIPEKPVNVDSSYDKYPFLLLLLIMYLLGIVMLVFRLIININQLLRLVRSNNIEPYGKYIIVHHNDDYPTFSFLRYIFLNSTNLDSNDMSIVLKHEEAHIRSWHTADMIFIELCKIVFWFNPVIWIFKRSLIKVHECEVDDYLIESRKEDVLNYQSLLLRQYLSNINIELAHPFNYSLVKFRIKMMTKNKSRAIAKFKIILALPVVIISLLAFSNANISLSKQEFTELVNSEKLWEPEPNGMAFIPAGSFVLKRSDGNTTKEFTVTIDAFWMNQAEVSVKQYFDYLKSVKKDSSELFYQTALPDVGKAPFKDYFSDKKYSDFPVVGVSFNQAKNFCKWLTTVENQKLKSKGKPPVQNFRIPSEVEWVYASFGSKDPVVPSIPKSTELSKVSANKPNDWGLYNMFSNVSEWTNTSFDPGKYMTAVQNYPTSDFEKIIVRGNNFKESLINDKLILNGADSYDFIGFRYVRSYLGSKYGKN
jgi:formylglycine-generating enzyme required for sulfatase activity/beta-lactamase regulating signal transducer with metallopeptidase domain